ncbi:MAG: hypothetical protein Q7S86_00325 [bacterium]|nr:hypothetical protein [bacterium]
MNKASIGKGMSDLSFYSRHRPKDQKVKTTQKVKLRCRQCKKTKTVNFGPEWTPPPDGVPSKCKHDCLAETVHDFVCVLTPEEK